MIRRLWHIFGPFICASVIVLALLLLPVRFTQPAPHTIANAAVSLQRNVLTGQRVKAAAVNDQYVPFIGSSELSRMDPFHPSVLATRYHRPYKTLLLGAPGTQSLTQYLNNAHLLAGMQGHRLVFIISPQWFTATGQRRDAFSYYYSPLAMTSWILNAHQNEATRYAARRFLAMTNNNALTRRALTQIAAGQPVTPAVRHVLQLQHRVLQNEEGLFARYASGRRNRWIHHEAARLPATATHAKLERLARHMATKASSSNHFGIDNGFFKHRLGHGRLEALRDSQQHFDYRQSPEYGDLELLLRLFAEHRLQVQFIIPPVNAKWARYTGLRPGMMRQTVRKITYQLRSQGFNHVLDLSRDQSQPHFMADTIHLGWRGWLAVDKAVRPFLTHKQPAPRYHLNPDFFSKEWRDAKTAP